MTRIVTNEWRGGTADAVPSCPACGAADRALHASRVFDNLNPASSDLWTFWRCSNCLSLYPDPRPSADSIADAYVEYYTHDVDRPSPQSKLRRWSVSMVNGYMSKRFHASLRPMSMLGMVLFTLIEPLRLKLDYHGRHLYMADTTRARRLLDIGSGNGEFLKRAITLGWRAVGLDPDPGAVRACIEQGLDAYEGFADNDAAALSGPFDAITLRHSIEHVSDPGSDLRHCLRRLRPGGMIWLAWPNPQGAGARLFRSAWRGLEAPRHLCIPSARAMHDMLIDAGFIAPRVLRRGHHARSIARESGRIAGYRSGPVNRVRERLAWLVGWWADAVATFVPTAGEELVMIAFAPESEHGHA